MGYGALVALKYFYPSFKKFLVRRFGDKIAVDSNFQKQLALSMPEVIGMLQCPNPSIRWWWHP